MRALVLLTLVCTGCLVRIDHSSRTHLRSEDSRALVARSVDDAALEVTRMLSRRGYTLVDSTHVDGGMLLKLKGARSIVTEGDDTETSSAQIGSVFYVLVEPVDAGYATVTLVGKPTRDGVEACGHTIVPITQRCDELEVTRTQALQMTGREEAEVVHGVLAELALEGLTVMPSAMAKSPPR